MIDQPQCLTGERQGKCERCKVRFIWKGKPLVSAAYCPTCRSPLYQTTHFLKWPHVRRTPLWGHRRYR